ncbi:MAG: HAMP domain-containing sensor histidine kinase [Sandaracinaceae bacterium]
MEMPERPSFRRRLTIQLGAALSLALFAVGAAVWVGAAAWSAYEARHVLRTEVAAVQNDAVEPAGTLDADRYYWDEPHHRYDAPRIDPIFLQVYDADGHLLRQSDNHAQLDEHEVPDTLLTATEADGPFDLLTTHRVDGGVLYSITEPLFAPDGQRVGTVQAARFVPALYADLGRLALGLALGLGALLALLAALVWTVGGRVVRPLQALTTHAAGLSAATLGERVPVPSDADREAAALAVALNASLARLDGAFAEMKRFTANAAHELQSPLTVLRGHVEVALRRERDPEAYRETLRLLDGEVDDMIRTVRGLLSLARVDAADAPLASETVDLAAIAREEVEAAGPRAEAKGLALGVHADTPALAVAHRDLVREAIRTLLDNAIKYTPTGHVAVAVGTRGREAWVAVEDSGPGIAPEHRALATDRFWRAADVQHLPGSGLGLALADRVARSNGGRLTLGEAEPHGLRAILAVPAAP